MYTEQECVAKLEDKYKENWKISIRKLVTPWNYCKQPVPISALKSNNIPHHYSVIVFL